MECDDREDHTVFREVRLVCWVWGSGIVSDSVPIILSRID